MPTRIEDLAGARHDGRRTLSMAAVAVAAFGLSWPASLATSTLVEAKTPGKTYCFLGKCHRVRTLAETQRLVGVQQIVHASHYDDPRRDRFNPSNLTSSGEWFRAGAADNAASPILPNGTIILAYNPSTRKAAVLRINNAGPYWGNRTLDVSRGAAHKLGFAGQGVSTLVTKVIRAPSPSEATYSRGRRYAAVPGYIGTHASVDAALIDARLRMEGAVPTETIPAPASMAVIAALPTPAAPPAPPPTSSQAIIAMAPQAPATQATLQPASSLTIGGGGGLGFGSTPVDVVTADRPSRKRSARARKRTVAARAVPRHVQIDWASNNPRTRSARTQKRTVALGDFRTTGRKVRISIANYDNNRRRAADRNGYFKVDCRSTPDLCNLSGRSGSGTRSTALRTSAASSSNKP